METCCQGYLKDPGTITNCQTPNQEMSWGSRCPGNHSFISWKCFVSNLWCILKFTILFRDITASNDLWLFFNNNFYSFTISLFYECLIITQFKFNMEMFKLQTLYEITLSSDNLVHVKEHATEVKCFHIICYKF